MKNASWGSALVNGVGLISNLMALYAANFVYENPYATGFGGHFQVGGRAGRVQVRHENPIVIYPWFIFYLSLLLLLYSI